MDETAVREHAQQMCDALVAGDVDRAISDVSDELRRNLGEVVSLLPLPVIEATIESIDRGASAVIVVLRLVGESDEVQVQTRWKDRNGQPKRKKSPSPRVKVPRLRQPVPPGVARPPGSARTDGFPVV
jgi:hypothetical protein